MTDCGFPTVTGWLIKGGLIGSVAELADLKAALGRLGVNQRGWRLLLNFGEDLFSPLIGSLISHRRPLAALENLAIYLRLLQRCEMDVPPPPELVRAWGRMSYPDGDGQHLVDVPVGLFRASWIEYVRLQFVGKGGREFLLTELREVVGWFFRTKQDRRLKANQLKSDWDWYWNKFAEWCVRCGHRFDHLREWEPLIGKRRVIRGVLAVELTSGDAIRQEGDVMHHCVASCIESCRRGLYRVFSLREPETGERLATLGVMKVGGDEDWWLEDCRGEDNADPEEYLMDVAGEVVRMCTEAEQLAAAAIVSSPEHSATRQAALFPDDPSDQ